MIQTLAYDKEAITEIYAADTFIKRFLGFMFRKKPHHGAILIKPCNSIHTFFMRFSIDVLFINENMEVIKKIEGLKPGKAIMPVKESKMVIESKEGMFKNIKVGDKIQLY